MPRFSKCLSDRHFLNIQRWRDKKPSVWLRGFVALLAAPGLGQGRPATPVVRLKPQHHLPGPALETLDSAHSQGPQVPIFTPGAGKKKKTMRHPPLPSLPLHPSPRHNPGDPKGCVNLAKHERPQRGSRPQPPSPLARPHNAPLCRACSQARDLAQG